MYLLNCVVDAVVFIWKGFGVLMVSAMTSRSPRGWHSHTLRVSREILIKNYRKSENLVGYWQMMGWTFRGPLIPRQNKNLKPFLTLKKVQKSLSRFNEILSKGCALTSPGGLWCFMLGILSSFIVIHLFWTHQRFGPTEVFCYYCRSYWLILKVPSSLSPI